MLPEPYEETIETIVTGVERGGDFNDRWLCTAHEVRWISDRPARPGSVVTIVIKETA